MNPHWKKKISHILILKLDEPFRNEEIFITPLFFKSSDFDFSFFWQFLIDILPLGSESVDPHIFADPDPGSQNLADPKHWEKV